MTKIILNIIIIPARSKLIIVSKNQRKKEEKKMLKSMVFIELSNLNGALIKIAKGPVKIDFKKLVQKVSYGSEVIDKTVYIVKTPENENQEGFFTFLEKSGFKVVTKELKIIRETNGEQKRKGNFDVEITSDIDQAFWRRDCKEIILFSGDSDFAYALEKVKEGGIKVKIVSSAATLSRELKAMADYLIFLEEIFDEIIIK